MEITGCVDVASVLRGQFQAMEAVGSQATVQIDRQRRLLLLSRDDWPGWSDFRSGGPMPGHPSAPVMLQRLATVTYRLATLADRRDVAAR